MIMAFFAENPLKLLTFFYKIIERKHECEWRYQLALITIKILIEIF